MELTPREQDLLDSARAGDDGVKGWFNALLLLGVGLPIVLDLAQAPGTAQRLVSLGLYVGVLGYYGQSLGRGRALIRKLDEARQAPRAVGPAASVPAPHAPHTDAPGH